MDFEELPNAQLTLIDIKKCQGIPLLEYVCGVADAYLSREDENGDIWSSTAPIMFYWRCLEVKQSIEELFERRKRNGQTFDDFKASYKRLDASFKDKFLNNKDLLNTIEAFDLDITKFWYLLLFIYDYVEDVSTNAPKLGKTAVEDLNDFMLKLDEADNLILKSRNRESYKVNNNETLDIIRKALSYYVKAYNNVASYEELKQLDLVSPINNASCCIGTVDEYTWDISHKKLLFTRLFQSFLENKKASTDTNKKEKVSKDKMILISRLIYTVGYDNKRYNEEYDENGDKNRMLSNLLRKYKSEHLPRHIGKIYME